MKIINCCIKEKDFCLGVVFEVIGFHAYILEDAIEFSSSIRGGLLNFSLYKTGTPYSRRGVPSFLRKYVEYKDLAFSKDKKIAKEQAKYLVKIILDRLYKEDKYDFDDLFGDSEQAVKDYNNNKANFRIK